MVCLAYGQHSAGILLHDWLNSLKRVEGSNYSLSLSRLLFNGITEADQGSTYQQIQKISSANNYGLAP